MLPPHGVWVTEATDVTARVALPQIRVETLIGSQANYEINIKITIYKIMKSIQH